MKKLLGLRTLAVVLAAVAEGETDPDAVRAIGRDLLEAEPLLRIDYLELVEAGSMTPAEYDSAVRDLTTFLVYLSEPVKLERQALGIWVLLFLAFFAMVAYLLKAEYWRDVH